MQLHLEPGSQTEQNAVLSDRLKKNLPRTALKGPKELWRRAHKDLTGCWGVVVDTSNKWPHLLRENLQRPTTRV